MAMTRSDVKERKRPESSDERKAARQHMEVLLDAALAETFPASDPVAISPPSSRD
jgi:hypothetical protein